MKKNVFGMMPHPERAADKELRNQDGKTLFKVSWRHYSNQTFSSYDNKILIHTYFLLKRYQYNYIFF